MAELATFSFKNNVDVIVDGHIITGWAAGEDDVTAERSNDGFSHVVGSAGDAAIFQSADETGTIKFKVLQHSSTNKFLSDKYAAAEAGEFVAFITTIKDLAGKDKVIGSECYLARPANLQRGGGIATVEWTVTALKLSILHGGDA